jgi:hypothetical protein
MAIQRRTGKGKPTARKPVCGADFPTDQGDPGDATPAGVRKSVSHRSAPSANASAAPPKASSPTVR